MWLLSSLGIYVLGMCSWRLAEIRRYPRRNYLAILAHYLHSPKPSCPLCESRVAYGPHDLLITVEGCDEAIVLEYLSSSSEQKTPQDKSLKEFRDYVDSRYRKVGKESASQCPKYDVIAMFTGRTTNCFDYGSKRTLEGWVGWLHDDSWKVCSPRRRLRASASLQVQLDTCVSS
jgi:hypothetical protein